jgi:hypothetical protein
MAHLSTPPLRPVPVDIKARRWTMRVIALLLGFQAAGLLCICMLYLRRMDWRDGFQAALTTAGALDSLLPVALLGTLAVFELLTAGSMWRLRPQAWLRAMIVQGILLIYCLSSYVGHRRDGFVYLLMLSCIVIVLYLNTNDVRITYQTSLFQRRERPRRA